MDLFFQNYSNTNFYLSLFSNISKEKLKDLNCQDQILILNADYVKYKNIKK